MKNLEKVRQMSFEEWNNFLFDLSAGCAICAYKHDESDCETFKCAQGFCEWLEQEVET